MCTIAFAQREDTTAIGRCACPSGGGRSALGSRRWDIGHDEPNDA
jgi:hypothetical protein